MPVVPFRLLGLDAEFRQRLKPVTPTGLNRQAATCNSNAVLDDAVGIDQKRMGNNSDLLLRKNEGRKEENTFSKCSRQQAPKHGPSAWFIPPALLISL